MLPPARPLRFANVGIDQFLLTGACVIVGWSMTETSGAAVAEVDVYDGLDAAGTELAFVTLSAGQSTRDLWAPSGLQVEQGVTVRVSVGAAVGVIYAIPGTEVDAWLLTQGLRPIWSGQQ